jgi:molybdenum transport protein
VFPLADAEIDRLLAEDVPCGDLTTQALGIGGRPGRITFAAREPMVVSATEEAVRLLTRTGATARLLVCSGARAEPGRMLLEAEGSAESLLAAWKVAQTLIEWSAGVATAVRDIVAAAQAVSPRVRVACTRKTVPLTRALSVRAVQAGGGVMHRLGLSETILLFPEHRAFLGAPLKQAGGDSAPHGPALAEAMARLLAEAPERSIVVEVTSGDDALEAAALGAHVIQLEKFAPEAVAQVVARLQATGRPRPLVAAAGGVNAANAAAYAATGADVLVTSAPYAARPRDVQVRITAA